MNKINSFCKFCKCDFTGTYYEHAVDATHRDLLVKNYYDVIKNQYTPGALCGQKSSEKIL